MTSSTPTTVVIVPGLRDHVEAHWQTHLAHALPNAVTVPPLTSDKLSLSARVDAIERALADITGPVILVAHSAGVLMVAHWAARHQRAIKAALLVTPPDLDSLWPASYPQPDELRSHGWTPLPRQPLPFKTLVAISDNDPLASPEAVRRLAADWQADTIALGAVGHLNPAAGFGPWPLALDLIRQLDQKA